MSTATTFTNATKTANTNICVTLPFVLYRCFCFYSHRLTENPFLHALQLLCYISWHPPVTSAGSHTVLSLCSADIFQANAQLDVLTAAVRTAAWSAAPYAYLLACLWECPLGPSVSHVTANQITKGWSVCLCVFEMCAFEPLISDILLGFVCVPKLKMVS